MVAEFKELYDTIVNSETFHSWFAKNPKVQLSHFFAQINQNYIPTSAWDLGFFNPEDEKITVFTLNEANEIIQKNTDDVFKQKQAKVHTLDPKELDNFLDFKETIAKNKDVSLIAEIKKASPSAGVLVKNFNHLNIAKMYIENGATCLSVLTEEKHFLGKLDYIKDIKINNWKF